MSQHPPVHHPKNPILGFHGWDETIPQGSVYLVSRYFFLLLLFFPARFFSLAQFFLSRQQFLYHFFFGPPLTASFFWEAPTYPPNLDPKPQPTYPLFPTNSPTSLILLAPSHPPPFAFTFITKAWIGQNFRSDARCQELQCGGSWSVKAKGAGSLGSVACHQELQHVVARTRKQEELNGSLKVSSLLLLLLHFLHFIFIFLFFVAKKTTMAMSSCCCRPLLLLCTKNDNK